MIPWFFGPESMQEVQISISLVTAGLSAFFGILILMLWVPSYKKKSTQAKAHIQGAYLFFAIAALFLVFGLYFAIIVALLVGVLILHVLWESVRIIREKNE